MVDAEIFVDRIADQRINDLNVLLEATRKQVTEQYDPGENDLNMRTLELAQIAPTEYFSDVVAEDIATILRDIRDAHSKDATTADEASYAAEAGKQIQEAVNFEGNPQEKLVRSYLAGLKIDYDALTKEEFVTFMVILEKADINRIRQQRSQRGRSKPLLPTARPRQGKETQISEKNTGQVENQPNPRCFLLPNPARQSPNSVVFLGLLSYGYPAYPRRSVVASGEYRRGYRC